MKRGYASVLHTVGHFPIKVILQLLASRNETVSVALTKILTYVSQWKIQLRDMDIGKE